MRPEVGGVFGQERIITKASLNGKPTYKNG